MTDTIILKNLLVRLDKYLNEEISLETIKADIWNVSQEMTSVHDRHTRELLQSAEGELDSIEFSVDSAEVGPRTRCYVSELRGRIAEIE